MKAFRGKPLYRNGSARENENESFPALREDPYLSLLSSFTVSTLAPREAARSSLCSGTLYGKVMPRQSMDIERSEFLVGIEVGNFGAYIIVSGDTKRQDFIGDVCILLFTCNWLW